MPSAVQNARFDNIDREMQSRSKAALAAVDPAAARVDIRTHPGLDHLAAGRDQKGARRLL